MPNGPQVEVLLGEDASADGRISAAYVTLPPGAGMPEHSHGESEAVVVVQTGAVVIYSGDQREALEPGSVALLGEGERVRLENPGETPATLLVFFAPGGFVRAFDSWPPVG
jgi:quercetin dioxygenase-like cupin family protein